MNLYMRKLSQKTKKQKQFRQISMKKKNITRKMESFNILSAFLFATIALLIAVTIYCY